ncbi:MAG: hypothetical protein ABR574_06895 [Cryomorphaceae bacterium]
MKYFISLSMGFIACMLISLSANAQVYNYADGEGPTPPDSVKGIYFGLNLGIYFANESTSRIYSGYGYQRDGVINNFSNSWLNQAIQGSPQAEDRTSDAMGLAPGEWIFDETDMPGLMTFNPAFMWAGHIRYMFNSDFGMFAEVGGANPVAVGEFTIQNLNPSADPLQDQRLRRFGIRGEEERLFVSLGLHKVLLRESLERQGISTTILPYVDLGFNVTFTKFEANFIDLETPNGIVDLTNNFNNQGQFLDNANLLTGSGFGGFGGVGAQVTLGSKFTLNFGYVASLSQITLGEVSERSIQHQVVLRAIYM